MPRRTWRGAGGGLGSLRGHRWHPATLLVVPLLPALALAARWSGDGGVERTQLVEPSPRVETTASAGGPAGPSVPLRPQAPGTVIVAAVVPSTMPAPTQPASPPGPLPVAPTPGRDAASRALLASGMPARARTAYQAAARWMAGTDPNCRLPWSLVAAIGRLESDHGRAGRSRLGADGRQSPPLLGVRLDGTTPGTGIVRDTDGGRLDHDTAFDRAVGPMQFLPAVWPAFGVDADDDGFADPQDVDDAALAAGRYLCAVAADAGKDLASDDGAWTAAYGYNRSTGYADLAVALATSYATGRPAAVRATGSVLSTAGAAGGTLTVSAPASASTSRPPTVRTPVTGSGPAASGSTGAVSTRPDGTSPGPSTTTTSTPGSASGSTRSSSTASGSTRSSSTASATSSSSTAGSTTTSGTSTSTSTSTSTAGDRIDTGTGTFDETLPTSAAGSPRDGTPDGSWRPHAPADVLRTAVGTAAAGL